MPRPPTSSRADDRGRAGGLRPASRYALALIGTALDLSRFLSLADFEPAARRILPRAVFGYVVNGSEDERTLRANREAFADWDLLPRMLVDVRRVNQETELFGRLWASPFGIPPMGSSALARRDGDRLLARAAHAANIPFILSGASSAPLERVIEAHPGAWFQGYLNAERESLGPMAERVARAGYEVLVVTVDVPVASNRERDYRNGFTMPPKPSLRLALDGLLHPRWLLGNLFATLLFDGMPHFENFGAQRGGPIIGVPNASFRDGRAAFDWAALEWLRARWPGRLVVKGVLAADDARRAREAGADGLIVSNHGGRQLDGAIASLRALPDIITAAGGPGGIAVMLDSGVRRGADIAKALALGAKCVFVGRPMMYALAVGGEPGVARAIAILRREFEIALALLGCTAVALVRAR